MEAQDFLNVSEKHYNWYRHLFQVLEKRLGLNIKVHGDQELLSQGDIFTFNHFARFETVIPPYIIYKASGFMCRSIADHNLFTAHEGLKKILISGGAVPNNLPGLLPFLASEILRGRKVVIFPEGGMVKDRRVLDEYGQFNIFSGVSQSYRKHHQGAAVLALTLDIFKERIKKLATNNDEERLQRWCDSLNLPSVEALLEQANKPTTIVPANITFNPLRISENVLTRGLDLLGKSAPGQLNEELIVEGNILFKNTDMDIRLGAPLTTKHKWNWWEHMVLKKYFLDVKSLDDLFKLRTNATTFFEKILSQSMARESARLRDEYMREIYQVVTINLGHIASTLVMLMIEKNQREIDKKEFNTALYLTLKALQNESEIHLHRGLLLYDKYRDLINGQNADLEQFLRTAAGAQLVEEKDGKYILLDDLYDKTEFHSVRLENPIQVSANEAAPIRKVRTFAAEALEKAAAPNLMQISNHLFDDELRAHAWNRANYTRKQYDDINKYETATNEGKPFLLTHLKPTKVGVLMVHGLLASPAEVQELGEHLHKKGHSVMGVRLSGHATSPWDLHHRNWQDWERSVKKGYEILSPFCDKIIIVGFSTGGCLALNLATKRPEKLAGIVSICAPLALQNRNIVFVPFVNRLNALASWVPRVNGVFLFRQENSEHPEINYQTQPINALHQLTNLMKHVKKKLSQVTAPTMVIQADKDPVIIPTAGQIIYDKIASTEKELHWVKSKKHGLVKDKIGDTWKLVEEFIEKKAKA